MLERFHVAEEDAVMVPEPGLRSTVQAIFEKVGVPTEDAVVAADVLVTADLRGVETHGVSNMLRNYVDGYNSGDINPRPDWRIVREWLSTANIDSDRGLGIIVTPKAMSIAIEKARHTGVGVVTIHNGRHLGMASYHAMMALEHNMIGVCVTMAPPSMVPTFGSVPRMGTNPIAVAAPAGKEAPFVFDAATTVVAGNKISLAMRLGAMLEPGWTADEQGTPYSEPTVPVRPYNMLPLGSTRENGSHKGYGLACVVDILSGILSGTSYGMYPGRPNFAHMVAAYNIEAFSDVDDFKSLMDDFLVTLKDTPPAPGHERVYYGGLPEAESVIERRSNGIPLHKEVVDWFNDICNEMSIPCNL